MPSSNYHQPTTSPRHSHTVSPPSNNPSLGITAWMSSSPSQLATDEALSLLRAPTRASAPYKATPPRARMACYQTGRSRSCEPTPFHSSMSEHNVDDPTKRLNRNHTHTYTHKYLLLRSETQPTHLNPTLQTIKSPLHASVSHFYYPHLLGQESPLSLPHCCNKTSIYLETCG